MYRIVFLAGYALTACTGGGDTTTGTPPPREGTDGGGSGNGGGGGAGTEARARAIVRTNGGAAASCADLPAYVVGAFGDAETGTEARPVENGATDNGSTVQVSCRVAPAAGGFALDASVSTDLGTFSLRGEVGANGEATTGELVLKTGPNAWSSSTCALQTSGNPSMGVAAGRYWALVSCPGAKSVKGDSCDVFGEVRFENCSQQ